MARPLSVMNQLLPVQRLERYPGGRLDLGRLFAADGEDLLVLGAVFEKSEEEIAIDLERIKPLMGGSTVLVTHSPAWGILDTGVLDDPTGSPAILAAVQDRGVWAHIHGHIHQCFGREGRHFNVSSGGQIMRGMVIDLDTLDHQVIDEGPLPGDRA